MGLQNVREPQRGGGSTNPFTLCRYISNLASFIYSMVWQVTKSLVGACEQDSTQLSLQVIYSVKCNLAVFASICIGLGMALQSQCTFIKNKNLNCLTHLSLWRLLFTCKTPANSCTPSHVIPFSLRLQNVRRKEMRGAWFTLCVKVSNVLSSVPKYQHRHEGMRLQFQSTPLKNIVYIILRWQITLNFQCQQTWNPSW